MTAIKKFAFALVFMAAAPIAAAQNPDVPVGLDLNGVWVLGERGERQDTAEPLVRIEHTGYNVTAKFLTGAECFDGTKRTVAFVGKLSFSVPDSAMSLSSDNMPVCSGSSSVVKKCGGSIPAMYQSNFTGVTIAPDFSTGKPNLIMGDRYAQGYDGCQRDSSSDGTHSFVLTRTSPCAVEERKFAEKEKAMLDLIRSVLSTREAFRLGFDAAKERYPTTFEGRPTDILRMPYQLVSHDEWAADSGNAGSFFTDFLPDQLASQEWRDARVMASAIGLTAANPLRPVAWMLEEMHRIEAMASDGVRAATELESARQALDACQQRAQQ